MGWLETPQAVVQLRDRLVEDYKVDSDQIERDLFALLGQLVDEGLIEVTAAPNPGA